MQSRRADQDIEGDPASVEQPTGRVTAVEELPPVDRVGRQQTDHTGSEERQRE